MFYDCVSRVCEAAEKVQTIKANADLIGVGMLMGTILVAILALAYAANRR